MLNVDAHNDAIKKERKMTLEQYTRNLRGICKDGSNPDPRLLGGCFERVARYEWQVEERAHMAHISAGWLYKSSRKMVGAAPRRLYSVLSTRALYFYREEADAEPVAYIRLEGLVCRHAIGKSGPKTFELRAASVDGKESETRMIKLKDTGDGPKAEMSKHSSFTFSCETERDAQRWAAAVRDYTVDDEAPAPPAEGGAAPSSVDGSGRSRNVSVDSRAASFRTASPVNVGPEEEDRSRGDSAVGLYHSRERRLSLSRGRFEKKDALKMLERKYEGVNQRTNATPAAGGRAHSASVGSNGSGGGGAGGGGGGGGGVASTGMGAPKMQGFGSGSMPAAPWSAPAPSAPAATAAGAPALAPNHTPVTPAAPPLTTGQSGDYASKLVAELTAPGGVRAAVPAEALRKFVAACATLDVGEVCVLLESTVGAPEWQRRLKVRPRPHPHFNLQP